MCVDKTLRGLHIETETFDNFYETNLLVSSNGNDGTITEEKMGRKITVNLNSVPIQGQEPAVKSQPCE